MIYEDLTFKIRAAIFNVYNHWGPGLFEQIYEESLAHELEKEGLKVETQVALPVIYDGVRLSCDYRLDMLVEDKIIVELKSVEKLQKVHFKQLLTYLKLADKRLGLLVNFNTANIMTSIHRVAN